MKVIVNVTSLAPPLTGIGWYTYNLLAGLLSSSQVRSVVGSSVGQFYSEQELRQLLTSSELGGAAGAGPGTAVINRGKVKAQVIAIARQLPFLRSIKQTVQHRLFERRMRQLTDHIYWEPNYILQPFAGRSIPTLHDLSHIRYPEYHPAARINHLEKHLGRSIEQAAHIIVVSEFTRSEVSTLLGIDNCHISVVSPGISADFYPREEYELLPVLERYGLKPGYLLSVGTLEPRKNLVGLLRSYLRCPASLRKHVPLVLVGARGWKSQETEKLIARAERSGEIIRLGYVSSKDLPLIYSGALALAYPSYYEGFGMPLAEAMASGTAVITSNCASMPEVVAGAGALVDPGNDDAIVAALVNVLEDHAQRENMIKKGLARAGELSWGHSLSDLLTTLSRVEAGVAE